MSVYDCKNGRICGEFGERESGREGEWEKQKLQKSKHGWTLHWSAIISNLNFASNTIKQLS